METISGCPAPAGRCAPALHRLERKRATPCGRAALLESARASPPWDARAPNGSRGGRGGGRMAAAAAWVPSEPVPLRPPSGAHQCHTWISLSALVPIRQPHVLPQTPTWRPGLHSGQSAKSVFPFDFHQGVRSVRQGCAPAGARGWMRRGCAKWSQVGWGRRFLEF